MPNYFSMTGTLVEGLPFPFNSNFYVCLEFDRFIIKTPVPIDRYKSEWKTFELALDKVDNVQLVQKRETKEVTEQSAAGMIIGAALFGSLGARVGGRAKSREKIQIHNLFIIDYTSEEQKQIVLDVSTDLKGAEKVVKRFKELRPNTNTNSVVQL